MARYAMVLMHGIRGGEGRYVFEADDDLMTRSPERVLRTAMDTLDERAGLGHIDYEINAALMNRDKGIVTALGNLIFHGDDVQPFGAFIAAA